MGQNKKLRHKSHQQKTIRVPSIIKLITAAEAYPDLAIKIHMGVDEFIRSPSIMSANHLSQQLCLIAGAMSHAANGAPILGRKDAHSIAINSAINAFQGVCDRHDRTGKVSVTKLESQTLIASAGQLDAVLNKVPAVCYDRADRELAEALAVEYVKTQEWRQRENYPTRAERRAEVAAVLDQP